MSPFLVALLGILLFPLFVSSWRISLFGLASQGALMALVAYRFEHGATTLGDWITLLDLGIARGVVAPLALYTVLRARQAPSRNDVIPPNLLSWTFALTLVFVSFSFSALLVPTPGAQRTLVAIAASAVLLGLLVLATQSDPFSQMIGVLRIENGIALLELGGERHEVAPGVRLGLMAVFLLTVACFRWYLVTLEAVPEEPTP